MKTPHSLFLLTTILISLFLLSGCTPHPGAGVWEAKDDNEYGISKLIVNYEGQAEFTTAKPDNATWHCFWGGINKQEARLSCTSSLNTEQEEIFILNVSDKGMAELRHDTRLNPGQRAKVVAIFTRLDENPSARK